MRCTGKESWQFHLSSRTRYLFWRIQLPRFPAGRSHRENKIGVASSAFGASLENVRLGVGAGSNLKTLYLSVTLSKTGSAKALWLIQVWSLYRGLCSGCDKAVAESKSINPNVFIFLNSSRVAYPWEERLFFLQKGSQWQIIVYFKIQFYSNNIKLHVNYIYC